MNCLKKLKLILRNSTIWLVALTILFSYCILTIQLNWFWKIPISVNPDPINALLLNISYSFIAASIFYVITVWLPSYNKQQRLLIPIRSLKKKILDDYSASINSFSDVINKIDYSSDHDVFIDKIQQQSLLEETPLSKMTSLNKGSYQSTILSYHDRVVHTISNLLEYKDILHPDEIVLLEEIRTDDFPQLLSSLSTPIGVEFLDTPDTRKSVGKKLWDLYQKAIQLQN